MQRCLGGAISPLKRTGGRWTLGNQAGVGGSSPEAPSKSADRWLRAWASGEACGTVDGPGTGVSEIGAGEWRRARGGPAGWAGGCAGTARPAAAGLSGFGFLRRGKWSR